MTDMGEEADSFVAILNRNVGGNSETCGA